MFLTQQGVAYTAMYKIINRKKRLATMAVDLVGQALVGPYRCLRKQEPVDPGRVRRMLVIRTAYTGDVMMSLPVLKPLRLRFPEASLTFLTSGAAAPVLENNPYVDRVMTFDPFWFYPSSPWSWVRFVRQLRRERFDLALELRGDIREFLGLLTPLRARYKVSCDIGGGRYLLTHVAPYTGATHRVVYHLNMARYLGCDTAQEPEWGVYLDRNEQRRVRERLAEAGVQAPFVAVHPGSRLPLKRWPVASCRRLYDRIIRDLGVSLVVLGAPGEVELVRDIVQGMETRPVSLAGRLSVRELAGVLDEASLFVCNDSAPMHIAAAMRTPTVSVFGPSKSDETGPYATASRVVEQTMPCRATCDENTCRHHQFHACMTSVSVDAVWDAVRALWRG